MYHLLLRQFVRDAFHEYVESLNYVNDLTKPALEKALQNFILAPPEYAIHTTSMKEGRLVYNLKWDCISNCMIFQKQSKIMIWNLMKDGNMLPVMKFFTLRKKPETDWRHKPKYQKCMENTWTCFKAIDFRRSFWRWKQRSRENPNIRPISI